VRWLLLKDLQILRRSPLQAALLIVYPVLIAVLVGIALSRDPAEPKVAFLNEVPSGTEVNIGGDGFSPSTARRQLCSRVDCVEVDTRDEALAKVRDGEVLGALIVPEDLVDQINSLSTLVPAQPTVEVVVNEADPVQAQLVDDRISSLLSEANLLIAQRVARSGGEYLDLILDGGETSLLGLTFEILGLRESARILEELVPAVPRGEMREALLDVIRFATLARDNLDLAGPLLTTVAEPIQVDRQVIDGPSPALELFGIAAAATVSLMFVTMLLVAGSLALEREENAFARLSRGLVSRTALIGEKVGLGVVVGIVVTLLLLAGLELFVSLDWARFPLWVAATAAGAAAFAAVGAALGAATREVRAASLLAFMISLPLALLSLVPSGSIGDGLREVIGVITAVFPFRPALDAITGALDVDGPAVGEEVVHLLILTAAYAVLARLALRRLAP
jgi:ABC-2 type transport system permease protein